MSDDIRIVNYHFLAYADPSLFSNDVLGRYHAEGTSELYRALYYLAAKAGLWDCYTRFAPFVLLTVCLVGLAIAAKRLGGYSAAFVTMALCLSTPLVIGRISGMLPRAFAFPILSLIAAALVTGRIRTIAALTLIGAGFYPVVTVIGLLVMAIVLFLLHPEDRGSAREWPFLHRIAMLSATAIACAVLTLPFAIRMNAYGSTIGESHLAQFPEAGPGGRQDSVTTPPHAPLPEAWAQAARLAIRGKGQALISSVQKQVLTDDARRDLLEDSLAYLAVIGAALFGLHKSAPMRRLAALALAVGVGYLVANRVAPSLVVPQRYALYGVPILVLLAVPTFPLGFLPRAWARRGSGGASRQSSVVLLCGMCVLTVFGYRGDSRGGLARFIDDSQKPLFDAVSRLPPDVLVAGWPTGTMNTLPVASHRTPFLSRELHVPYHSEMTLLMRARMYALIDAYFAAESPALIRLHREFGVTHLVVEWSRLGAPPRYFKPFYPAVVEAHRRGQARGFEVERQVERCASFRDDSYALLDLACVAKSN